MDVAVFKGGVNKMDYEYKDYDARKWNFYPGWLVVRHLPKFSISSGFLINTDSGGSTAPDSDTRNSGVADADVTRLPSRGTKRGRESEEK